MENDNALEIAGVGTIRLKMHDGTIRKIQGMRHVKGLKKNLLYVGQLGDLGCKIHTKSEILKVVKGNFVVMKAEKITSNLYILKKDILQEADASIAAASHEVTRMMWHRKLGYFVNIGKWVKHTFVELPHVW